MIFACFDLSWKKVVYLKSTYRYSTFFFSVVNEISPNGKTRKLWESGLWQSFLRYRFSLQFQLPSILENKDWELRFRENGYGTPANQALISWPSSINFWRSPIRIRLPEGGAVVLALPLPFVLASLVSARETGLSLRGDIWLICVAYFEADFYVIHKK